MTQATVFIGLSLDGMIDGPGGDMSWLAEAPQDPAAGDMGFADIIASHDAIVMGRTTFDFVHASGQWPYTKPVIVLSNSMTEVPADKIGKAEVMSGDVALVAQTLAARGLTKLYVDGGRVIQDFFGAGLVTRLILTRLPIVLGGGTSLFANVPRTGLSHIRTTVIGEVVQSEYEVKA